MFIWVYHPISMHGKTSDRIREKTYQWIRSRITSRLPIKLQELLYLCLVVPFVLRRRLISLFKKPTDKRNWREKMQNLIDTFSPPYVNRHTEQEILTWYRDTGFSDCSISYRERYGFGARADFLNGSEGVANANDGSEQALLVGGGR